jgi:type VI secretion system secreted protein VgrG
MALSQDNRPLKVTTPLGANAFVLTNFSAREGLSQPFQYYLEMVASNDTEVKFEKLLGQKVTVEIAVQQQSRFFNGIVSRVSQGTRDGTVTIYRAEVVPQLWLLTRKWQSRIFQRLNVPDILKKVLTGIDTSFEITGTFEKRDYCVQYRETDFNFVSRLMEEEGIYYYFKHTSDGHKMVLANTPQSHADVPGPTTIHFDETSGGDRPDLRIISWTKIQEMRSGKCTLFDHSFELPHKHLEADKTTQDQVQVGTVPHTLKVGGNDKLEIYDFPGEYAQRFDGIDKGGGEQPAELQKIFTDNKRTVGIRMEQEAMPAIEISGSGTAPQMLAGHKFTLDRHFNADGQYVINTVLHGARQLSFSNTEEDFQYSNSFTCLPIALPYRPPRSSPRPVVQGTQTAVVVGPPGEEIFTDKFGRVKVQFHWDRDGKNNIDSSCWIRVGQLWAGKRWGASFWPRIGQEVIVDFLEGDPDQPIIIGSVYNADQMPPYLGKGLDSKHKEDNKVSGVKSNSTPGGKGFNELRFDDNAGKEEVFFHAQKDLDIRVRNETRERVISNRHLIVGFKDGNEDGDFQQGGDQRELVYQDKHLNVKRDQIEKIEGNLKLTVGKGEASDGGKVDIVIEKDKKETIGGNNHLHVTGDRMEHIDGNQNYRVSKGRREVVEGNYGLHVGGDHGVAIEGAMSLAVTKDLDEKITGGFSLAGKTIYLKADTTMVLEAGTQLSLKVGGNFVDISSSGVTIMGTMVQINSGGSAGSGSAGSQVTRDKGDEAVDAEEAKPTKPDMADSSKTGSKSAP